MSETNSWEQKRRDNQWPTPNAMRNAAVALKKLSPARYGEVLEHVADLCDGKVEDIVEGLDLKFELVDTLGALNEQILRVGKDARSRSIPASSLRSTSGEYTLAPLLVAKASVLEALATLEALTKLDEE